MIPSGLSFLPSLGFAFLYFDPVFSRLPPPDGKMAARNAQLISSKLQVQWTGDPASVPSFLAKVSLCFTGFERVM